VETDALLFESRLQAVNKNKIRLQVRVFPNLSIKYPSMLIL
jgi:hypothetical protein